MSTLALTGSGRKDEFLVTDCETRKRYSITFNRAFQLKEDGTCVIPAKNHRETELLLLCLADAVDVIMDEEAQLLYPEVWDMLKGRTIREIVRDLKWSYKEGEELLQLIERIPVPKDLIERFNTNSPQKIDQKLVHKLNEGNVLISEPYKCGNMLHFYGFRGSREFRIDHASDHMEGILIFEAARQSAIASLHLAGIPIEGRMIMLKVTTKYIRFVENNSPYFIRTIPVVKPKGGYCYIVFDIVQDETVCVTGMFEAFSFKNKEVYEKFRRTKLV